MLGTWIIAGGSASLALGAVSIRAISRTTGRGRQDPLEPTNPLPSESVSEQPGCPVGKAAIPDSSRLWRRMP
jgi:hypothetical protein